MIRPENMQSYPDIDLKLGIKSSLPNVKATLALLILIWKSNDFPSSILYSSQNGDKICLNDEVSNKLLQYSVPIYTKAGLSDAEFLNLLNENQMLKSQLEALIVAFELVWKVAKISFQDNKKAASAERTGGKRYPKQLCYTINMDVLQAAMSANEEEYRNILLKWVGLKINANAVLENNLCSILTMLSEGAVFKLSDNGEDIIFNQNEIYEKLLTSGDKVDINGDKEAKGSLRILKSLLSDELNPHLKYAGGTVSAANNEKIQLKDYQERVNTFLSLSTTKVVGQDEFSYDFEDKNVSMVAESKTEYGVTGLKKIIKRFPRKNLIHPLNQIIYGAPGTGKTYSSAEYAMAIIENRIVNVTQRTLAERKTLMDKYEDYIINGQITFTTFHQSYGYEEFIQGIRPDSASGMISFDKADGVFKKIADRALLDESNNYVIIIDEINRGNISKIFGELITLIEEDKRCGELNQLSATLPLGDFFTVPNNLYIIGTMNSADKSISLIDTALRRRFSFVEMAPDESTIEDDILRNVLFALNGYLRKELRSSDLLIGHSYFIEKTPEMLGNIMNRNIIPLLYEYFYDDEAKVKKALDCLAGTDYVIDNEYRGRIRIQKKV